MSSSCPRSSLMFPSPSKKISPISPRGPKICPLASTQAFPSSSLLTKLPSSSKRGILIGVPFTSKLMGIFRSIHVPSVGLVVITIGKGRLSGPIWAWSVSSTHSIHSSTLPGIPLGPKISFPIAPGIFPKPSLMSSQMSVCCSSVNSVTSTASFSGSA